MGKQGHTTAEERKPYAFSSTLCSHFTIFVNYFVLYCFVSYLARNGALNEMGRSRVLFNSFFKKSV
jgi:hypothetical protein